MYVNSKDLLLNAKKQGYGVIAADCWSLDSAYVIVNAAIRERFPLILQFYYLDSIVNDPYRICMLVKEMAGTTNVPIVLHLDHGPDKKSVYECIHAGFSSVMVDASTKPFDENVAITKAVVEVAKACGISVEAELGHVGSNRDESDENVYTEPAAALDFVQKTGIDSLAISIGTAHGIYRNTPNLNFEILEKIASTIDVPLVLHGGSNTGFDNLKKAVASGITKINVYTDLLNACKDGYDPAAHIETEVMLANMEKRLIEYFNAFSRRWE